MNFATICSGIDAPSVAWKPLGWEQSFSAEIEPFPCAVLKHHQPNIPNLGDITQYDQWTKQQLDVLIGGTPCQSFSVAGLRKGMADPRGSLVLTFLGIVDRLLPTWFVWENVPGVLSNDRRRSFGAFLGGVAKIGYGFAYCILDAQYRGLAQRRKRVFVVGHIGGQWQRAAAVLFDCESLCGNPPPSRQTRQDVAPTISARTKGGGGLGTDFDCDGGLIPINMQAAAKNGVKSPNMLGIGKAGDPAFTVNASDQHAVAHTLRSGGSSAASHGARAGDKDLNLIPKICGTLSDGDPCVAWSMAVRRLTPRECERLQGFPDDYTRIAWRGKPAEQCPDGPRHKALGNSMAVPVIRYLGERIELVNKIP